MPNSIVMEAGGLSPQGSMPMMPYCSNSSSSGIRIKRTSSSGSGGAAHAVFGTSPPPGLMGSSADSSWTNTPKDSFLLGSSPPTGFLGSSADAHGSSFSGKEGKRNPAKRFWSRLLYDDALDATEFQVGFMEVYTCDQRRSGKEAWSERQHHQPVELSFEDFRSRFPSKDVPFHRILYFKQNGAVVWDSHKRDTSPPLEHEFGALSMEQSEVSLPEAAAEATGAEEHPQGPSVTELPHECWNIILQRLGTRELCMLSRASKGLRELCMQGDMWTRCYTNLFGAEPNDEYNAATVRRLCRRSELRAARWLEVSGNDLEFDFAGTSCMQVDDSKVISAHGSSIRLWSHVTGRRISKLPGQSSSAAVATLACDDDLIAAGCSQGYVRLWGMDDLKFIRALRGHGGPVTDVKMLNGMPLSASEDGTVRIWDPAQAAAVVTMDADSAVNALAVDCANGRLTSAGWTLDVWDVATAQRLVQLANPLGDADDDIGLMFDMMESPEAGGLGAFTKVSQHGSMLAAAAPGVVSLWDFRTSSRVNNLQLQDPTAKVSGLQIDEWKLLTSTEGSSSVLMYDIRALGSGASGALAQRHKPWPEAVKAFDAGSTVSCFQFHGDQLVVGAAEATHVWRFGQAAAASSPGPGEEHPPQPLLPHGNKSWKEKKKPVKVAKGQRKYPKRTTR